MRTHYGPAGELEGDDEGGGSAGLVAFVTEQTIYGD